MIKLKLTDAEAKVLREILITVQGVYETLSHAEWAGDGDVTHEKHMVADSAVKEILHQLQLDEAFEAGAQVGASEAEITDAIEMFEQVEQNGSWCWKVDELSEGVISILIELAENEGYNWCFDLGDSDDSPDPVNLLIIEKEGK